jgi:hypothetical protein
MNNFLFSLLTLFIIYSSSSELAAQIDFTTQVQPIFTNNCTSSACHDSDGPQQGLDLTAGNSYNNIVDVASAQRANEVRVKPGSLSESYLYRKLINSDIDGQPMPRGSFPMDSTLVNTIRDWITQGALVTSVTDNSTGLPITFELEQNYPNPFNPTTLIAYSIDHPIGVPVSLKIFNLNGQSVKTLVQGTHQAGKYQVKWDGTDDNGHRLASGIYVYRLTAGNTTKAKKLSLLR